MTAFHSSPRMLGQKQDKFWLTVGLCAPTAALIFLPFYLLDGGFFPLCRRFQQPADQLLPLHERLSQGGRLPRRIRRREEYLFLGN